MHFHVWKSGSVEKRVDSGVIFTRVMCQARGGVMRIWRVEGENRFVCAHSKTVVKAVLGIGKSDLKWLTAEELTQLFLSGQQVECIIDPPLVQCRSATPMQSRQSVGAVP